MRRKHHRNDGLRKICACPRRQWAKCAHSWHFNYRPRHGASYRFSLDATLGRRVRSKTEAEEEAARIKAGILAGTFRRPGEIPVPAQQPAALTFGAFGATYVERASAVSGKKTWKNDRGMMNRLAAFVLSGPGGKQAFGEKPLVGVTEDDVEVFFAELRGQGYAASTRNKYLQLCKSMFRWAAKKGYLARNPLGDCEIKREKMAQRKRRLTPDVLDRDGAVKEPGEERRLLAVSGPHLQRLVIAALETGCRQGELLNLAWGDVDLKRRELRVRAEYAKDREHRTLPISARLAAVLEMVRTDPTGTQYPADAYVFGELGRKVRSVKRAWETAVLKAHGHKPEWQRGRLTAVSRAELRAINLHFHDLRHDAGSRFVEAGWPLHHVQEMLGHADLKQTSTYLNVTFAGLQESMRKYDAAGKLCKPVASEAQIDHPPSRNADPEAITKALVN